MKAVGNDRRYFLPPIRAEPDGFGAGPKHRKNKIKKKGKSRREVGWPL